MLPTNFLDSPTKKIKDLVEAAKVTYDPSFTLKQYVRSAQTILTKVNGCPGEAQGGVLPELTFWLFWRATQSRHKWAHGRAVGRGGLNVNEGEYTNMWGRHAIW